MDTKNAPKKKIKKRDYKTLYELKKRLNDNIPLLNIKLFGSRARGDAGKYSDMDVFIETEKIDREIKEIIKTIVWEVSLENSVIISPLIFSKDELTNSPLAHAPIVKNIFEEGVNI
ncbi:MAG: hypothetical protein GX654_07940 [Desulfatiglans sp.]|nr:hypothetical protein [Desulfatiglans sp.]